MILEIIGGTIGKQFRVVDESPEDSPARRQREGDPTKIIESARSIKASARRWENSYDHQRLLMFLLTVKRRLKGEPHG